jgi:hypothetical protein
MPWRELMVPQLDELLALVGGRTLVSTTRFVVKRKRRIKK